MKFETPSKPVVRLAYYADNKLQNNSQDTVGHMLMLLCDKDLHVGDFLNTGDVSLESCVLNEYLHPDFSKPASLEGHKRPLLGKSLDLLRNWSVLDNHTANQTMTS